jgi:4-amino-4-deoxy-L-arabinose transferase-like glycosyltransferase
MDQPETQTRNQTHNGAGQSDEQAIADQLEQPQPAARQPSETRWLAYLGVLGVGMVLVVGLPIPFSTGAMVAVLLLALGLAARDAELTFNRARRLIHDFPAMLRHLPARVRTIQRERLALYGGLAAVTVFLATAYSVRPEAGTDYLDDALFWLVVGGLLLGWSIRLSGFHPVSVTPSDQPLNPTRSNWWFTALGVGTLLVLAEMNGAVLEIFSPVPTSTQFILLVGGIALIADGMGGASRLRWPDVPVWEVLAVAGIFIMALAIRVVGLNDTLRSLVDEVHWITGIQNVQWNPNLPLFKSISTFLPNSLVYSYWQASMVNLFGNNLAGLRLTSSVVGSINIVALYLLARSTFNRRIALLAAVLLATFPPHIHFSRIAMAHVADATSGTLALAFMMRGARHNRRIDWVLCGVALGLTQYFYEGGRLMFPPLLAGSVGLMILLMRGRLMAQWRGLVVAILTTVFVALPVYYTIFATASSTTNRLDDAGLGVNYWEDILVDGVSNDEIVMVFNRFTLPLKVFVNQRELAVYYGGNQALVVEYMIPLFLIGLWWVVWRGRSPALLLLLWLGMTALGNAFMRDSAQFPRYVVAFPAIALIMALGLHDTLRLLWRRSQRSLTALLTAMTLFFGVAQVHYYFYPHLGPPPLK